MYTETMLEFIDKVILESFIVQDALTECKENSELGTILIRLNYAMQEVLKEKLSGTVLKDNIKLIDADKIDIRVVIPSTTHAHLSKPFVPLSTSYESNIFRYAEQEAIRYNPTVSVFNQYGIHCTCAINLIFNELQVIPFTAPDDTPSLFVYINSMSGELVSSLLITDIADARGCPYWT